MIKYKILIFVTFLTVVVSCKKNTTDENEKKEDIIINEYIGVLSYTVTKIHNTPLEEAIEKYNRIDYVIEIELINYRKGEDFEGRVKFLRAGWKDIAGTDPLYDHSFFVEYTEDPRITTCGFSNLEIKTYSIKGFFQFRGPLVDTVYDEFYGIIND